MCGIAGSYLFHSEDHKIDPQPTINALVHRGPDSQDSKIIGSLNLTHSRLAIIDTSQGSNQPMTDESGRYHLVFNGEIYNYRSIKSQLQNKGISFITDGDTEVVLKQLIVKGISGLSDLNGFFSLAFYDKQEDKLIVARDRFGIKPLLYSIDDNKLAFASEMDALQTLIQAEELDPTSMHFYFSLNYIPGPNTIFKNIKKLEPGHFLIIENKKLREQIYYSNTTSKKDRFTSDFETAKKRLRQLLEQSVQDRLISDVPLGTFLSGGIDSSIVTSLASRFQQNIESFSVGFKANKYFDESKYAKTVANKLGIKHNLIMLEEQDLLDCIDEFLLAIDEPFADSSALAYFLLSKYTRKHVTVALSGDGADELLGGYNKYVALQKSLTPSFSNVVLKASKPLLGVLPNSRSSYVGNKSRQITKYADGLQKSDYDRYWSWCTFTDEAEVRKFLKPQVSDDSIKTVKNHFLKEQGSYDLNDILLADQSLVMCNDMLFKADKMSMANSLEVRVPFLDHNVVEFVRSLPPNFKVYKGSGKYILKEAFKDMLPQEILNRPKKGFEVPLESWFNGPLKRRLLTSLSDDLITMQNVFDIDYIKNLKNRIVKNDIGDSVHLVWSIFIFQAFWLKQNRST